MGILNLNDIIEQDENLKFELNGVVYNLNADFETLVKYENLINEWKDKEFNTEYGEQLLQLILGEQYEQFSKELKNVIKSPKQIDRILTLIFEKWMNEIGFEKNGDKKKW